MIGKTVSHYTIVEKLGSGGMGVVYKALDARLGRTVAIKFLPEELTRDEEARERFIREARAASVLEHPNICTIYEIDETPEGQLFIAMGYYPGDTLKNIMDKSRRQGQPMEEETVLELALQVARGLAEAHRKGVVHRDVKPANVAIAEDGTAKILDFGLAKRKGERQPEGTELTVGTAAYMSPEQARGEDTDFRTDIWAFGVTLYEMLTGELPFKGEYEQALIYAVLNEEPEPVQSLRPNLALNWQPILDRCLAKNPADRYQRTEELVSDLLRLKGESSAARAVLLEARKKPNLRKLVGAGVLAMLILLAAFWGLHHFQSRTAPDKQIPIAVIDFKNETGEAELEGLSGLLITALEQSRRLRVLTRSRMFDILRQIGQTNVARIDETLGLQICRQANVPAMALATIRKFGSVYSIDLKVLDVRKNEYLFATNVRGKGQESIPSLIDQLSDKTRLEMRESASEVQARSRPVKEMTSTNLEAYQHFFRGEQLINQLRFEEAQKEFKKAIALDSTFGLAYYRLAYAVSWSLGTESYSVRLIDRAMHLLSHIPPREQYLVRAVHAQINQGFRAGLAVLREMEKVYPDDQEMIYNIGDWSFHVGDYLVAEKYLHKTLAMDSTNTRALEHLAWTYRDLGQYDRFLRTSKLYVRHCPSSESYMLLGAAYACTRQVRKGIQRLQKDLSLFPERPYIQLGLSDLYTYVDQYDSAEQVLAPLLTDQGGSLSERLLRLDRAAIVAAYQGRIRHALKLRDRMATLALQAGDTVAAGTAIWHRAFLWLRVWHNRERCSGEIKRFEALGPTAAQNAVSRAALTILAIDRGDFEAAHRARSLQPISDIWRTTIDFLVASAKGEETTAESTAIHILPLWDPGMKTMIYYKLGRLRFDHKKYGEAIAAFDSLGQQMSNAYALRPIYYPLSIYWSGRCYEALGNLSLARKHYRKFLALWKRGDPDLPDLKEARRRLTRLEKKN